MGALILAVASTKSYPPLRSGVITVVIGPSANNWNDFGHKLMVTVVVVNANGDSLVLTTDVKAYIEGESDTSNFLHSLDESREVSSGRIKDRPFVLTLGTKKNYQSFIRHVGSEIALEVLLEARDAAALNLSSPSDPDFLELSKSPAFHEGILRTSEAYFAFVGLRRILDESREPRDQQTFPVAISFVEGVSREGSLMTLNFVEDPLGANRFHAFIGPNGIGKTRLLTNMAESLSGHSPTIQDDALRAHLQEVVAANRRRTIVLTAEPDRWSQVRADGVQVEPIGISGDSWGRLSGELFELVRTSSTDESDFSWPALMRIVRREIPLEGLTFRRGNGTTFGWRSAARDFGLQAARTAQEFDRTKPVMFFDHEEEQFLELSSGQKAILVFLVRLFRSAGRYSAVIIDEPETHLHPRYIGLMMQALHNALEATESVGIIATHSPYVIQQVSRASVTVLRKGADGATEFAEPTFQTRGGDLSSISAYVFERPETEQPLVRDLILTYLSRQVHLSDAQLVETLGKELGDEGMQLARQLRAEQFDA